MGDQQPILDVDNGSVLPVVVSSDGHMATRTRGQKAAEEEEEEGREDATSPAFSYFSVNSTPRQVSSSNVSCNTGEILLFTEPKKIDSVQCMGLLSS